MVPTQRAAAGSDAPISTVGGSRQTAHTSARSSMAGKPCPTAADVDAVHQRHAEQRQNAADADAQLHRGIHPQRMQRSRPGDARQRQAAQAQPAHEGGQQHAERNRGRADHQLQQLVPDDFVNQRGAAAGGEQHQKQREKAARRARIRGKGLFCHVDG